LIRVGGVTESLVISPSSRCLVPILHQLLGVISLSRLLFGRFCFVFLFRFVSFRFKAKTHREEQKESHSGAETIIPTKQNQTKPINQIKKREKKKKKKKRERETLEIARMDRNTDQQPGKICPLLQQRRGIKKLDNNSFRNQSEDKTKTKPKIKIQTRNYSHFLFFFSFFFFFSVK